jgi:hypothetical protein
MGHLTDLLTHGFTVVEAPAWLDDADLVSLAYDEAFASAPDSQIRRGSTTTRFGGLVTIEPFCRIYLHAQLLELAFERLGGSFKLSSFFARTLRPHTPAPPLHQDVQPGSDGDPLVGFIFMVDAFTLENGATRFIPGSRDLSTLPSGAPEHRACGPAGSLLIFDAATWHEHGANRTNAPRRSVQGYFVRHDQPAAERWGEQLSEEEARSLPVEARKLLRL